MSLGMKGNLYNTFANIQQYGIRSIHFRNLVIILLFIVIPILILSTFLFNITTSYITEEVRKSNADILEKNIYSVDNELKKIQDMFFLLSTDSSIQDILNAKKIDPMKYSDLEKVKRIITTFGIANNLDANISDFFIYLYASDSVIDSKGFFSKRSESRFARLINMHQEKKEGVYENIFQYREDSGGSVKNYFTLTHRISAQNPANDAVLFLNINERSINNMLNINTNLSEPTVMIVDTTGKILCHMESPKVGVFLEKDILKQLSGKKGFHVSKREEGYLAWAYSTSSYMGWKYISTVSLDVLYRKLNYYKRLFTLITMVTVFIVMIISLFITNKLSEPINVLMSFIDRQNNWFDEKEASRIKFPEIQQITANILTSLKENEELKTSLKDRVLLLKKAQFEALQSQINPHFLYNTLEAINWSIREQLGLVNEPSTLINSLSEFLRFSLEQGDNLICIANEISSLKNYIDIQKFRLGNSFEVHWDISEELYRYKMIKISLQPLVENAIFHGIKHMKKDAQILILGRRVEDAIRIEIRDNGKGMTPERLEHIQGMLKESQFQQVESIGMMNVNLRFKILFGERWGISVDSKADEGTRVFLDFPVISVG